MIKSMTNSQKTNYFSISRNRPPLLPNGERALLFIHVLFWKEDKQLINVYPLFSQVGTTNYPFKSSHKYLDEIVYPYLHDFLLWICLNNYPKSSSNLQSLKIKFEFEDRWWLLTLFKSSNIHVIIIKLIQLWDIMKICWFSKYLATNSLKTFKFKQIGK